MENSHHLHKVERAIILAAGYGNRMLPLTKQTPKPLIKVNGKPMIETIIDALVVNEIEEIYVVVGHLKEQFLPLPNKYPQVSLIENPFYQDTNNISSLFVARDHLENVVIMDGDQIIRNLTVLARTFSRSGYNCIWSEGPTEEWVLTLDEKANVVACSPEGSDKGWQLYSISRWSTEDGRRLSQLLEYEFLEKKNHQIFWDAIPLLIHPSEFVLGIREMERDDVLEIDEYADLIRIDPSHQL